MQKNLLFCELEYSNQSQSLICTNNKMLALNRSKKEALKIEYGTAESPFGKCFLAKTQWGICKLAFFDTEIEESKIEKELYLEWAHFAFVRNNAKSKPQCEIIFSDKNNWHEPLPLLLKGTSFQLDVWKTLLSLPSNYLVSYEAIAEKILKPKAVRAVASAIAKNKIAYLIPCHRVIRKNGDIGQYRWKRHRKKELIAWEEKYCPSTNL